MPDLSSLDSRVTALEGRAAASNSTKDFWDRLSAVGGLATPLVVAALGIYLPYRLGESQRQRDIVAAEASTRVAKANIIPPLMDALLSQDAKRRQLAVSTLLIALPVEGPELARLVASSDPSEEVKQYANQSLDRRKQALFGALFSGDAPTRIDAAQSIIAGWRDDRALVPELIGYANDHRDNPNGVYNAAIIMQGLSPTALSGNKEVILDFAAWAQAQGPKTAEAITELMGKLP